MTLADPVTWGESPSLRADLHSHSTVSDGWYEPAELVDIQAAHGTQLVALTDHDTLAGVAHARRRAHELGLGHVVGVEITAAPARGMNHMLAHGVRVDDPPLLALLERNRLMWRAEVHAVLAHLERQGLPRLPELLDLAETALVMPNTVARHTVVTGLAGHDDIWDEIRRGLPPTSDPMYARMPGPQEVAEVVHGAGGLVVWAHPGQSEDPEPMRAAVAAFDGIEVYTPRHDDATVAELLRLCAAHDLPATSGNDFHGYLDRDYRPIAVALERRYVDRLAERHAGTRGPESP